MREHDFGWVFSHGEADQLERVRVNGRWFHARRQWAPTSMSFSTEADTSYLRNVYVNGERFTRAIEKDYNDLED